MELLIMKIYEINEEYIEYLHSIDSKVENSKEKIINLQENI